MKAEANNEQLNMCKKASESVDQLLHFHMVRVLILKSFWEKKKICSEKELISCLAITVYLSQVLDKSFR